MGGEIPQHSFPVLCKGDNSGKPLKKPCPNCFIVTCNNEADKMLCYQVTWGLWKAQIFHAWLLGSVIPYIRIGSFKSVLDGAMRKAMLNPNRYLKAIETMQELEQFQELKLQQMKTARELQYAIFCKFLR